MHEMRDVGDGLERNLCAIEGAAARRPAGLKLLGAALLALFFGLALILPQPGSLKTSWILFESELIHVSWAAVFLVMAGLDAAMTASGIYRMMS